MTLQDVRSAYWLLFNREVDNAGLAYWTESLRSGVSPAAFAEELINSTEFARRYPGLVGAYRTETETVELTDFSIVVEPSDWAVGGPISRNRVYEPEVSQTIRDLLSPGDSFIDVGANIGWYSLLAASVVGPAGRVLAIEPNLRNVTLIRDSARLNQFEHLQVFSGAVHDTSTWLALETEASNGRVLPLGVISSQTQPVPCSYAVPAIPLDDLLEGYAWTEVRVMKIDVEGAEKSVLRGAERLLDKARPTVVFEWFPDALASTGGVDPIEPLELLRSLDYSLNVVGQSPVAQGLTNEEIQGVLRARDHYMLDVIASPTSR